MRSPIYWHPAIYGFTLRKLYGHELDARFSAVVPLITEAAGDSATLLDVCAGDGAIRRLLPPQLQYIPLDGNETFVRGLRAAGFPAVWLNVREDPLPSADIVLMMGSLYHFVPDHARIVEKLRASAGRRLIIVEPHVNWAAKGGVLGRVARWMSHPGISGSHLGRLSEQDLEALAQVTKPSAVQRMQREWILVYD